MFPNIQNNLLTKYSRVLGHLKLRTILYETYDELICENKLIKNRIKSKKLIDLIRDCNNQLDVLFIVYGHSYYDECYTGWY